MEELMVEIFGVHQKLSTKTNCISSFIGKQKKAGTHFLAMSPGLASFLWNNFH